ncbi:MULTISPECIES: transglycosylase family protein [Streptomyces]|uniref:Transglycosylase family protein n=1 Tax=Streptomyces chilikensis TaxID=1194079 RepID=A0ABV3EY93_9ACTN|nr:MULTISPECIES: transglycosylase family protein [Streptomyces]MDH6226573.1 LysM repeat protein [Streptomyces sp. MJP52]
MSFTCQGKHRRPSKAKRALAVAGLTGAVVAAPLLTAGTASAATESEWDAVAQCESGGDWSINTGNGFYGGLQFTSQTWAGFGGTQYAAQANQATKAQQIEIAEKVLAEQGPGAWPHCGTGLSGTPYQGGAAEAPAQEAPQQEAPQQEAPAPAPQPEEKPAQPAKAKKAPKAEKVTTPTGEKVLKGDGEYKVVKGDSLSLIAEEHDIKGGWKKLYKLNKDVVEDPRLIYPGQMLHLG